MPLEELRSVHKAAKVSRLKACLKAIDMGVPPSIVYPGDSLLSHGWAQGSVVSESSIICCATVAMHLGRLHGGNAWSTCI